VRPPDFSRGYFRRAWEYWQEDVAGAIRARMAQMVADHIPGQAWVCPECVQGKHQNCDGQAWDFDADEPTGCGCECRKEGSR
jgi:hypothetical protein